MTEPTLTARSLQNVLDSNNSDELNQFLATLTLSDRVWIISRLEPSYYENLMALMDSKDAAHLLFELEADQARELLSAADPGKAASIADEIQSDVRADIIGGMSDRNSQAIIQRMIPEEADDVKELIGYGSNTAGGLMITEYLVYSSQSTIKEIIADMQENGERYADYIVQYAYIVDENDRLVGVLRIRDMLFTSMEKLACNVMIKNPICVRTDTTLQELEQLFDEKDYFGIPVVDKDHHFVGVLRGAAVRESVASNANRVFLKISGIIGGEEFRNMTLFKRSSRRLAFLTLNIFLNILAASVIAMNMEVLDQVIALAVFMPIISDMSGCSGNQAVAVTIRELSMGVLKPKEFPRVFLKESAVGIINGIALGLLIGGIAFLWKGNIWLAIVVGSSLCLNTIVAVCFGGVVPLILKRMKVDPALMSGPMLTTVTDMCGFLTVLTLARMMLEKLM